VGIVAVTLICLSVPAYLNLECGLENELSTTVGSDLYDYFIDMKSYLDAGPPTYVIMNNFVYIKDSQGIPKTNEV
jgi:hypothetical protein